MSSFAKSYWAIFIILYSSYKKGKIICPANSWKASHGVATQVHEPFQIKVSLTIAQMNNSLLLFWFLENLTGNRMIERRIQFKNLSPYKRFRRKGFDKKTSHSSQALCVKLSFHWWMPFKCKQSGCPLIF